jgi:hypothetical protein
MNTITLTDEHLQTFIEISRATLARSTQQIAVLRTRFPKISNADIQAMSARIENDPDTGTRRETIDVAAYFLALHMRAHERVHAALAELGSNGTPATLHDLFLLLLGCADFVNALTLLAGGGLAPELHLEEARRLAISTSKKSAADARHAPTNEAKAWVQQQWKDHGERHNHNKSEFARHYVELVKQEFDADVSPKTIAEVWLAPSAIEN